MEIECLETFTKRSVSVVRVRTDDGREGVGQISPYNADISATVFHRQIAPHVLGADPFANGELIRRCLEAEYKFPGTYMCRALAGLDTALWDLRGKVEDKSVCQLLGGRAGTVKAYGSSMRRDIEAADEARRLKTLKEERGYEAFKIRLGTKMGHNRDPWSGRTQALVPAVREAVGDDVEIFVDANSCYTPEKAIEVGRMLEANDVTHYEEPCPYWDIEATAEVREALDVPVAGGEQDNDLRQWRRIIDLPAVDIVQPDICYVGGLTRALKVADMADAAGIPCTPHSANHSLVTVFTLHMLGAIDNAGSYLEFSIEPQWAEGMYSPALTVEDGKVDIPEGPGWGVTIDSEWLATADYRYTDRC